MSINAYLEITLKNIKKDHIDHIIEVVNQIIEKHNLIGCFIEPEITEANGDYRIDYLPDTDEYPMVISGVTKWAKEIESDIFSELKSIDPEISVELFYNDTDTDVWKKKSSKKREKGNITKISNDLKHTQNNSGIINRHKFDISGIEWVYPMCQENINDLISKSKKKSSFLDLIYEESLNAFIYAVVLNKEKDVKHFLELALRAQYSLIQLKANAGREAEINIDDTEPVFLKSEDDDLIDYNEWLNAFYLSLIMREKEKDLKTLPFEKIKKTLPTINFSTEFAYNLFAFFYVSESQKEKYFNDAMVIINKYAAELNPKPGLNGYSYLFLRRKWLLVAKSIFDNDNNAFNAHLYDAIDDHQKYWSQKRGLNPGSSPLCDEPQGFISLQLTALCSMAYDKGFQIEVKSDYIPEFLFKNN